MRAASVSVFAHDPDGYQHEANWTAAGWAWKQAGTSRATARLEPHDAKCSDDLGFRVVAVRLPVALPGTHAGQ